MENYNHSSSRKDRKTIEKNRRNHMKNLYSKLNSLVPHHTSSISGELVPLPDQLDEATNYINSLHTKLEKMKEKKNMLMGIENSNSSSSTSEETLVGLRSPQVEIHEMGKALEVVLITGLDCQFMFNQTIKILHEEGAEVVNATFSVLEDTIFHTIYSEVGESTTEYGVSKISERIKKFVNGANSV